MQAWEPKNDSRRRADEDLLPITLPAAGAGQDTVGVVAGRGASSLGSALKGSDAPSSAGSQKLSLYINSRRCK